MPGCRRQSPAIDAGVGDQHVVDAGITQMHGLRRSKRKNSVKTRYFQKLSNQCGAAYGLAGYPNGQPGCGVDQRRGVAPRRVYVDRGQRRRCSPQRLRQPPHGHQAGTTTTPSWSA
ncbi:Uncharacterised protein [Mycobacteroides abscessus subsp. abscessus]|nr:Uncharacterised protein [Mycobacteroides abscessus subsp. abscessus]